MIKERRTDLLTPQQTSIIYASEGDVLNMENINAVLIEDGLSQKERLIKLNKITTQGVVFNLSTALI